MNLVVVEDAPLIREQLLRLLAQEPRIRVQGTASTENEALDLIRRGQPQAIVLDLGLAQGNGVRLLERLRAEGCSAQVLILTNNLGEPLRQRCAELGAAGYYDKSLEVSACLQHLYSWLPPIEREVETAPMPWPRSEPSRFDEVIRLACLVLDVPIVLVSHRDPDQQWQLSPHGLTAQEAERCMEFCVRNAGDGGVVEGGDVQEGPDWDPHVLVRSGPPLRFYAGAALSGPQGEPLGSLFVFDTRERTLDAVQREGLHLLAGRVRAEIEWRRRLDELDRAAQQRGGTEAQLRRLAAQDPLTGLANRCTFLDRLGVQVRQARRRGEGFAVMFLDLDRFKWVNDTLGHEVGDRLLALAADRLRDTLRQSDTVARLSGDEFAVLMPELVQTQEAELLASKLVQVLAQPYELAGRKLHLGVSVGVAIYPQHGEVEALMRHADLAMYEAKRQGGGRMALFTPALDAHAEARLALENELDDAIAHGALTVWYQPQIGLSDFGLRGVEALVRWQHPRMGLVSPERFIPLAEECGLIGAIGLAVLDQALAQLASWDRQGMEVPRVAVNVSPVELGEDYVDLLQAALGRHGIAPQRLELEITETALWGESTQLLRTLVRVRDLGVQVAVDDFGVGYSSLGNLRRLPIDALKIDRSFLRDLEHSEKDEAILQAVVTMARTLGLRTVAEGVETTGQLGRIWAQGCDSLQGYLISRPLPAAAFTEWLQQDHAGPPSHYELPQALRDKALSSPSPST